MSSSDEADLVGRVIGGYRVEHRLGAGGMGTVLAAVEPTIGRRVAIKLLKRELATDPATALRFEREARSMTLVRHPATIDVFAFGKLDDGRPFFVMPLLEGRSLRQELDTRSRFAPSEAWRIAREIAAGVGAAHRAGVLHRDLKPDNVFLSDIAGRPSQPVVLDFGLAKLLEGAGDLDEAALADQQKLTQTGVPLGTPIYMAPEQWWSAPTTRATDQYAFGVLLFELLAGRPPFQSQRFPELLEQHLHARPPRLTEHGVEVPSAVQALIDRLLAKEPEERYRDFDEVIATGDRAFAASSEDRRELEGGRTELAVAPPPRTEPRAPSIPNVVAAAPVDSIEGSIVNEQASAWVNRAYVASLVLGFGAVFATGYAGAERFIVKEWIKSAGWGALAMLALAVIGIVALPFVAKGVRSRPLLGPVALGIAFAPSVIALVSTVSGWGLVNGHLGELEPGRAYEILHRGYYEVGLSSFLGFSITAVLALGLAVLLDTRRTLDWRKLVRDPFAGLGLVGLLAAAVLAASSRPAATFVTAMGGLGCLVLARAGAAPDRLVRERSVAILGAALSARGVSRACADAWASTAWFEPETRADRVHTIVTTAAQSRFTAVISIVIVVIVAGGVALSLVRARDAGALARARGGWLLIALQGASILALLAPSVTVEREFAARREALAKALSEQFQLFSTLSPPVIASSRELRKPSSAPALQITRETIAVNGKGVGRIVSLDNPAGRQAIAAAIVAALADPSGGTERHADLSMIADASLPWRRLLEILQLVREGGGRTIELLLTRGAVVRIPPEAPPDAGYLIPRDFGALSIVLGDDGFAAESDASYETIARALEDKDDGANEIAVSVPLKK
ncbi:MAG: serine/threonine-protein kinase [Polyangiaceae bacterium]